MIDWMRDTVNGAWNVISFYAEVLFFVFCVWRYRDHQGQPTEEAKLCFEMERSRGTETERDQDTETERDRDTEENTNVGTKKTHGVLKETNNLLRDYKESLWFRDLPYKSRLGN